MEGLEQICFEIIANAGAARSCYVQAMDEAKAGNFETAQKLMSDGNTMKTEAHKVHASLISQEAAGQSVDLTLLLVHAQDQLMSCEEFEVMANQLMTVYEELSELKKKI